MLVSLFFLAFTLPLSAQEDDPSEIFLKAYLSAQQGEKLEHENRFKSALAKFRFAGSLVETLRKSHPDWQPAVVEYRGRKIAEGILRIQERISRQTELTAGPSPLPDLVPSLPDTEGWSEPGPEVVASQGVDAISEESTDAAIEQATRKLRRKVDQLQAALEKSRSELQGAQKDKEAINSRLQETRSKLVNAQQEIESSKESEHQVRDQLAQTQASLKTLQASQENSATDQLRAQLANLQNEVAVAQDARAKAERQRDDANAKLADATRQIAVAEQQRDEALVQLKAGIGTEQHTEGLLSWNGNFKPMLASAEKGVLGNDDPTNADELAEVKQEVSQLQQQLAESQKQNQYLVARIAELGVQLDATSAQLQSAKLNGKNNEETDRLIRENELLRNIVVRERQEEARRDGARKSMLAELDRLQIKSEALNKQIELLAEPVTKLSSEELNLLHQPVISVSDQNPGVLTASFIFAKKSGEDSVADEASTKNSDGLKGDPHDEAKSIAHAEKESFTGPSTGPQKAMSETSGPDSN